MGAVWRARDTRLGREVALKVLPDEFAGSAERRSRFEHEAKLLASLSHPAIATLHDVLDHDESPDERMGAPTGAPAGVMRVP
jgi:serine/threonine protein kinase